MAHYKGNAQYLSFGGTDISAMMRTVEVSEAPGEPEKIDVTHKGDTARDYLEGFPGGDNTTVTANILASDVTTDPLWGIAANTSGAIIVGPEGTGSGALQITVAAARLVEKTYTVPYDGAVEWNISFNSVNAAVYTKYA